MRDFIDITGIVYNCPSVKYSIRYTTIHIKVLTTSQFDSCLRYFNNYLHENNKMSAFIVWNVITM